MANIEFYKNLDLNDIVYFNEEIGEYLTEKWEDVVGYRGRYKVSDLGRIKSFLKYGSSVRILKLRIVKKGYLNVRLTDRLTYTHKVHRLVAIAFIPNPENLPQVNHIGLYPDGREGNKLDNRAISLKWSTNKDNIQHAYKNGLITQAKGEEKPNSKLTEKDVLEIRAIGKTKTLSEISKIYNVQHPCIHKVLQGKTWKHVK